jgi:hypothetical protein
MRAHAMKEIFMKDETLKVWMTPESELQGVPAPAIDSRRFR